MPLDVWAAVALDVVAWSIVSLAAGGWCARQPAARFAGRGPILRLRPWERAGRWYEERLHVKRWKDRLPEAGGWFGGLSKRRLPRGTAPGDRRARLTRFAQECARAETVHWLILAVTPLFALWNPPWLFAVMVVFALVANVACIVVPRYNRARIEAVLEADAPR